ncbi:MAG: DUF1801 domain-containing protein [Pedobacter sp.]|nr:MAG: DUF1801 domain-containing protein [Pedobacter sp.]
MNKEINSYNEQQSEYRKICDVLAQTINNELKEAESKIWHSHPVWFLNENPIVGYSKQKAGIRLMFWSGASFEVIQLNILGKKFKDASIFFTKAEQIDIAALVDWLKKSREIQWDYKNLVKRKGELIRLS